MKLFKKANSRFYWFDFTVRGQRYRGSTGETKAVRATKVASMKLAQALEHGDLFPTKPTVLAEFSQRFQSWLDEARLEEKTRKYYRNPFLSVGNVVCDDFDGERSVTISLPVAEAVG